MKLNRRRICVYEFNDWVHKITLEEICFMYQASQYEWHSMNHQNLAHVEQKIEKKYKVPTIRWEILVYKEILLRIKRIWVSVIKIYITSKKLKYIDNFVGAFPNHN